MIFTENISDDIIIMWIISLILPAMDLILATMSRGQTTVQDGKSFGNWGMAPSFLIVANNPESMIRPISSRVFQLIHQMAGRLTSFKIITRLFAG